MKLFKNLFIIFFLLSFKALAQNTPNIGFENGDFSNWVCYSGLINTAGVSNVAVTTPSTPYFTIIGQESKGITDEYGGFPILCPNGSNYCVKINDNSAAQPDGTSNKVQRITYTFQAPAAGAYSIIFNYAVVLENPNHSYLQQPKFTAQVYDVTDGNYIDCPSFEFVPGTSLPGFTEATVAGNANSSIFYKDWSTATIDLKNYHNKTIRLEFSVNDCAVENGKHFGYAYIDVQDNTSSSGISGNAYCLGQKYMTLLGPTGFLGYTWYSGTDFSTPIGQGQALRVAPPPANMTPYSLIVQPYDGLGCVDTLYTVVNQINEGFKLNVQDTVRGCPGSGVDLTAASVTAGSSAGMTLSYYTDSLGTAFLYNPDMVVTPGKYYIQGVNAEGCENILPVNVVFGLPTITIIEPAAVNFPVTVDLTKTYVPVAGLTYAFYTDTGATDLVFNPTAIKYGGTYYIKATNQYGCTVVTPVNIIIHPPPPYTITGPNTFTPNGDGINDHFQLSATGVVTFGSIRIYTRYGQLVYTGKSFSEYWDGNLNGRNLPTGTYYWVFDGEDDYNNVKITKGGFITLIR